MDSMFWRFITIIAGYYALSLAGYCFLQSGKYYRKGEHDSEAIAGCLGVACVCVAEVLAIVGAKM